MSEKNKKSNSFSSKDLGIRKGLNALGFDDTKIDWDGTNVTYDGKAIFTPTENDNGTTKTDTNSFIQGVNNIYKNQNDNSTLADVSSYASSTGIKNLVEYGSDGSVSVGGVQVPNTIIIDGQSYAKASDIQNALSKSSANKGLNTSIDIFNQNYGENGKYRNTIESLIDKLENRKDFSYDVNDDPAYKAYKEIYETNANNARDEIYGDMATMTGGYANSAALAAASNAYFDHMEQLNSKIPELYKDAYERYQDKYESYADLLDQVGSPLDLYDRQEKALSDTRYEISEALSADRDRTQQIIENTLQQDNQNFEQEYKNDELDFNKQYKNDELEFDKEQEAFDQNYKNATLEEKIIQNIIDNDFKEREITIDEEQNERQKELQDYEIEKIIEYTNKLKRS